MPPRGGTKRAAAAAVEPAAPAAPAEPAAPALPAEPAAPAVPAEPAARALAAQEHARRRAAHFAVYDGGVDAVGAAAADPAHAGASGAAARELGPWASATQLAGARPSQRRAREAKLAAAARALAEAAADAAAAPAWAPPRDPALGRRRGGPGAGPPTLQALTLRLAAEHIEAVESLWGLPDGVRARLAAAAAEARTLSPAAARLFSAGSPAELILPDCSRLEEADLRAALVEAATPALARLELKSCGRGLGDGAARALAAAGPLCALTSLRLDGAYRLEDAGAAALLQAMPNLKELALTRAPRLGGIVEELPRIAPGITALDLSESRGAGANALHAAAKGLRELERLALDGLPEVDDDLVAALAAAAPRLRALSLRACGVGDAGAAALARSATGLRELFLDETGVGAVGVHALAGCRALERLGLGRCCVDDAGLAALAAALPRLRSLSLYACITLGPGGVGALAASAGASLEELDLSWCRRVDGAALGRLVDACRALRRLTLWGLAPGDAFLHGHGGEELVVVGAEGGEVLQPVDHLRF
jgi:hypothetical protein